MPKQIYFEDENGNKMTCYINQHNKIFVNVGDLDNEELYHSGYICLESEDVEELIELLKELKDQLDGKVNLN